VSVSRERLGIMFILVGPGGAGKNALMNQVLAQLNNLQQLPTATTRPMRPSEQQGREHLFVSFDNFQQMIDDGELLEYQEVHPGKFYGVPRASVENAITTGRDLIADIEFLGAEILRETYPENSVAIFIAPPSVDELIRRLRNRQATDEEIADRIARLPTEMLYAPVCDYVIINGDVERSTVELRTIVQTERESDDAGSEASSLSARVTYRIVVVPVLGDEALCKVDHGMAFPSSILAQGDKPDEAALMVIQDALGITPAPDRLYHEVPGGKLPVDIQYSPDQHRCEITFYYVYRLSERIDRPGWRWKLSDQIAL
jgi:guanylate kinase